MAAPYTPQTASGYNSGPPADDGSQVASNQILWATIKTKLADPVKTLADDIDDAVEAALALMFGGSAVTLQTTDYTIISTDQGKLIRQSGSNKTFTTPDATSVGAPFVFAVLNSHATDNLTIDGFGAQTVNGAATVVVPAGQGCIIDTDGSNWFSYGSILTTAALTVASLTSTGAVSGTDITASGAVSAATVTGAAVATQANQETASATNLIVTPGRQQFHPSAAKAWGDVLINGTLNASYNVSGVVKDSTGDWTVSFTTAFSAANYAVVVTARNANASAVLSVPSKATGSFTVKAQNTSGTDVDVDFFFVCYGDQ